MIQSEIILNNDENAFVDELNYFLEKLGNHQLVDVKFSVQFVDSRLLYQALVLYEME